MWWLWLAACKEELECPAGEVAKGGTCVPTQVDDTGFDRPELVVIPEFLDLGVVQMPCSVERTVEVRNGGDSRMDVESIEFSSEDGAIALDPDTVPDVPFSLDPGEFVTLGFRLEAEAPGADQGVLTIQTSDPLAPTTFRSSGVVELLGERTETVIAPPPRADILLLVDTSCSMYDDNIDDVTIGIPEMLTALDQAADWQLAVISSPNGCMNMPLVSDASPTTAREVVDNVFLYPQHYLSESLFAMGQEALSRLNGCNVGMLRPGSQLHFIVVSDEPEQSGVGWQQWLNTFRAYSETFVVSAVVDHTVSCGAGASGYVETASATGGVILDVCQPAWGPDLSSVVQAINDGVVAPIPLAEVPLESSIRVEVNGVPVDSFRYNAGANTIEDILPPPRPGDEVSVSYGFPAECAE
jgi:hypothetical protein